MIGQKLCDFTGVGNRFVDRFALGKQFRIEGTGDDVSARLRFLERQDEFAVRYGEVPCHDP